MPILAPRSPQYRSSVNPLSGLPRLQADLRPALASGNAIANFGRLISIRANELKQERDAAVVGDLYNQWRDEDRKQLSQLLEHKGKNAVSLDQKYDGYFNESFANAEKEAENGTQQRMLGELVNTKRSQNLDILARYQAVEGQRYKAEVQQGMVVQAEKDVRQFGFNDTGVTQTIDELNQWIDTAYPGKDTVALKQQYKSQLLFANMQERINLDPDAALETLESWKEDLGEGYFKLKNAAEAKSKEKLVERLRDEVNQKFTDGLEPNFNKMEDAIQKDKTIPDDIKDNVVVWIRSQESEYNARERKRKADTQDVEMDKIFGLINEGKFPDAYRATIEASELNEKQKYQIEQLLKASAKKDQFKTDEPTYMEAAKAAMTEDISRDEIIDGIGKYWTAEDARQLQADLKRSEAPGQKVLNDSIKEAADAIEKQIVKGNQLTGWNPDSINDAYEAIKEFQKQIADPPEGVTVEDMLDPESPDYIVQKIVNSKTVGLSEQIKRMSDQYRLDDKVSRKEGETPEDFLMRINK